MEKIQLIHPIYLDVPMLVSFAAATQGGLSLEAEITAETGKNKSHSEEISGKLGLSKLFQSLFEAEVTAEMSGNRTSEEHETRKESKAHTESSIAILLYHELTKAGGYILQPESIDEIKSYEPGTLVEISGTIKKNAIDQMIDYADAVDILSQLNSSNNPQPTTKAHKKTQKPSVHKKSDVQLLRDALILDRKRTPISNVILHCLKPAEFNAVVTLRSENLRDLTLSELHKNSVRVVGKVTRVINEGESMCSFENYGMALLGTEALSEMLETLTEDSGSAMDFSDIEVAGPAFQLLPLMVFV